MKQQQQQQTQTKRIRNRHPMAMKNGGGGSGNGGHSNNGNRSSQSSPKNATNRRSAMQMYDRYTALARDAASSGDRVEAERHYQLAEHYYRTAHPEGTERPAPVPEALNDEALFLEEDLAPVPEVVEEIVFEAPTVPEPRPQPRTRERRVPTFAPPEPTVSAISFPFEDAGPQPALSDQDIEKLIEGSL